MGGKQNTPESPARLAENHAPSLGQGLLVSGGQVGNLLWNGYPSSLGLEVNEAAYMCASLAR